MTDILLCGCLGRMGHAVFDAAQKSSDARICAGVDANAGTGALGQSYPMYERISDFPGKADVIIDFSYHTSAPAILDYAIKTGTPAVIATTGHTDGELKLIAEASEKVALLRSGNMSLGINLLMELVKRAAEVLGDCCDIEIIERHHNKKLDAPSGTALMLADAAKTGLSYEPEYIFDRTGRRQARDKKEIGISSVRGGNVVGEHEVGFYCENEIITLNHTATSRDVFANGALAAARYLIGKAPGLYSMKDVVAG